MLTWSWRHWLVDCRSGSTKRCQNGGMSEEFKRCKEEAEVRPDIVCIQEPWLRPYLDLIWPWYESVRSDRIENQGVSCATFVREGIAFRRISTITEIECIVIEICKTDDMVVVNFYNPCRALCQEILDSLIKKQKNRREIWCGDFEGS